MNRIIFIVSLSLLVAACSLPWPANTGDAMILRPTVPPIETTPPPQSPTATETPSLTPTPTVIPSIPPTPQPQGAFIELHVFPPNSALWTQVEWQDAWGDWHLVTGWQGTLDTWNGYEGIKRWWFSSSLFCAGPFRWVVRSRDGYGEILAVSQPFTLPCVNNETREIVLSIP